MPETRLDVLCIGNAIVDVIANASDDFLTREGLAKGSMRLIDAEEAERLYARHGTGAPGERRVRGQHGGGRRGARRARRLHRPGRAGRARRLLSPRPDERWRGVHHAGRGRRRAHGTIDDPRDARRAPDDEHLPRRCPASAGERARRGADRPKRRSSISKAICGIRRRRATRCCERSKSPAQAGRKVAFTLSDTFCVDRHRDGFNALLDERRIDILFANQAEIEALAGVPHLDSAVAAVKDKVETLVVTRQRGRRARHAQRPAGGRSRRAHRQARRYDRRGRPVRRRFPARRSARARARNVAAARRDLRGRGHPAFGARPEKDLRALAGELLP